MPNPSPLSYKNSIKRRDSFIRLSLLAIFFIFGYETELSDHGNSWITSERRTESIRNTFRRTGSQLSRRKRQSKARSVISRKVNVWPNYGSFCLLMSNDLSVGCDWDLWNMFNIFKHSHLFCQYLLFITSDSLQTCEFASSQKCCRF